MPMFRVTAHRDYKVTYEEILTVEADDAQQAMECLKRGEFTDHEYTYIMAEETEFPQGPYRPFDVEEIEED